VCVCMCGVLIHIHMYRIMCVYKYIDIHTQIHQHIHIQRHTHRGKYNSAIRHLYACNIYNKPNTKKNLTSWQAAQKLELKSTGSSTSFRPSTKLISLVFALSRTSTQLVGLAFSAKFRPRMENSHILDKNGSNSDF